LRLEEPARTMRGVPARWVWPSSGDRRIRRSVTAWSCSCGAAPGR